MQKEKIMDELKLLCQQELGNPFPYSDTELIQKSFECEFSLLSGNNCFNADFNDYCMTIAGTISYLINGNADKVPARQANLIKLSFFERFSGYSFLESKLADYPLFNEEYVSFEKARKQLLQFLIE